MTEALVSVRNVCVDYTIQTGKLNAVENISIEIYAGDFLALLGPSGCGKTTLLNVIAGYHEPTNGQVRLRGEPIRGPGRERGVIFQRSSCNVFVGVVEKEEIPPKSAKVKNTTALAANKGGIS